VHQPTAESIINMWKEVLGVNVELTTMDRGVYSAARRNGKPLTRYFPELVAAAKAELPEKAVVDGEIGVPALIGETHRLDWDPPAQPTPPADTRGTMPPGKTPAHLHRATGPRGSDDDRATGARRTIGPMSDGKTLRRRKWTVHRGRAEGRASTPPTTDWGTGTNIVRSARGIADANIVRTRPLARRRRARSLRVEHRRCRHRHHSGRPHRAR